MFNEKSVQHFILKTYCFFYSYVFSSKKTSRKFKKKIFFLVFSFFQFFKNISFFIVCFVLSGCLPTSKKKPSLSTYCRTFRPYKINNKNYYPLTSYNYCGKGVASYYHGRFHGRKTSSGEIFDNNKFTAAHKTLPMHSVVRITNLDNKKSIVVRINDRGPFSKKRIIDVSVATAKALGFINKGVTNVSLEVLKKESKQEARKHNFNLPS